MDRITKLQNVVKLYFLFELEFKEVGFLFDNKKYLVLL
jgi:hypothetical protein